MRRLVVLLGLIGVGAAAVAASFTGSWPFVLAAVVGGVGVFWLGQCRHPGPLGLLPPTTEADGSAVPARWYCDSCGKTWPAEFDHGHPPVRKFDGYDPTKAVTAARRADDLARRQRALALRRAGLEAARPAKPQPEFHPDTAEVVELRRFAK
jgi:hypothetical protein